MYTESGVYAMKTEIRTVDVICQHSRDGTISPMRVRVRDEEGEYQAYTIKGFNDISHQGTRELPDGVYVTDRTLVFECFISVFGRKKMVRLYYEPASTVWKMTAI